MQRQRNQEQHQQGKVDRANFHSGLPYIHVGTGREKFKLSLPPVQRVTIPSCGTSGFINSRSRGGASPWHVLDQTSGKGFLLSTGATQCSRENRFTLLATRFHLVQSRSHRIYVNSLVSIELR